MRRLNAYVAASTANPTGYRPWGYKLGDYDPRARYLTGMGASFNRPGGINQARWATRDNYNAPLPVYGAPELLPGHYGGGGLGIIIPPRLISPNGNGAAPYGRPVYANEGTQNSPQPVVFPGAPQTTLPQPTLTPATVQSIPQAAVSSSGAPISTGTPASTVATPAVTPGSIQDLYNQAVTWLQSQTVIPGLPNFVPAGGLALALLMLTSSGKGRR